ncbi:bcl2-associated agonist of cell death [Discoglossus pictus]
MTDSSEPMFCIDELDHDEQGSAFPTTDPPHVTGIPGRQNRSSPNLRRAREKEFRFRADSYTDATETDSLGEMQSFRSRSRSAPSSLLVAARYGRELRRMSDEFDLCFQGLPRPKSANAASQMTESRSFKDMFLSLWGRRRRKGRSESTEEVQ